MLFTAVFLFAVLGVILLIDVLLARRRLNLAVRILVAFAIGIGFGLLCREVPALTIEG